MDCPKCKSPNPDDAAFCSLCCESFKAKKAGSGPGLAFAGVSANVGRWNVSGPMLIREEGFYFFIKNLGNIDQAVARSAAGGLVGALVVEAVSAAVGEPEPPEPLRGKPAQEIAELARKHLPEAPEMAGCERYFLVPKQEITELGFDFIGQLVFKAGELGFRISGTGDKDKLSGFLVMRGYPLRR